MNVIYQRGHSSAAEVMENLPDPPSYSAVRALLKILVDKGHLKRHQDGPRYIYLPTVSPEKAKRRALKQMVHTFFEDSTVQAVAALLDLSDADLSSNELDRLAQLIEQAKNEGR